MQAHLTIVVSNSHGNGENLLIEKLPDDITLVRSWPRPLMMLQGIDSTFAAAVFFGYHASTPGTQRTTTPHQHRAGNTMPSPFMNGVSRCSIVPRTAARPASGSERTSGPRVVLSTRNAQ